MENDIMSQINFKDISKELDELVACIFNHLNFF